MASMMGLPLTIKYRRHIDDAISVKCWKLDEINTRLITVKIRTVALLTVYSMGRQKMKNNKWYAHCSLCDPDEWCNGWSSLKNQELCSTTAKKSINEARLSSTGPEPLRCPALPWGHRGLWRCMCLLWWENESVSPCSSVQHLEKEEGLMVSHGCMVVILLQPLQVPVFTAVVKLWLSSSFCSRSRKLSFELNNSLC